MPSSLGRYQLLEKLATGGMGEVWLGRPRGDPDALVVVKRLLPHLKDDHDLVTLFLDEARIASSLKHPNIAAIHELGEDKGDYFLVMDFVHGRQFSDVLAKASEKLEGMPVPMQVRVLADTADALDFAHNAKTPTGTPLNLIHRDVSPQNIMIGFDGSVKLIDFGVAKANNKVLRTATGIIRGKHAYMSPEQAYGKDLDSRSDVFGLGIVLWEALSGDRLFRRKSPMETMKAVVGAPIDPPSKRNREVPKALDAIVLKALARDKEDRYGSAAEFKQALERFLVKARLPATNEHLSAFMHEVMPEEAARDFKNITDEVDLTAAESKPLDARVKIPKLRVINRAPLEGHIERLTTNELTSGALFNALTIAILRLLGPAYDPRIKRIAADPKPYLDALKYLTSDFLRLVWKTADFVALEQQLSDAEAFEKVGITMGHGFLESPNAKPLIGLSGDGPATFLEPFLTALNEMIKPGERRLTRGPARKATVTLVNEVVPPAWLGGLIAGMCQVLHRAQVKSQIVSDGGVVELRLTW